MLITPRSFRSSWQQASHFTSFTWACCTAALPHNSLRAPGFCAHGLCQWSKTSLLQKNNFVHFVTLGDCIAIHDHCKLLHVHGEIQMAMSIHLFLMAPSKRVAALILMVLGMLLCYENALTLAAGEFEKRVAEGKYNTNDSQFITVSSTMTLCLLRKVWQRC